MLEKVKQSQETSNAELASELKQVTAARTEAERRRKQVEAQLQETSIKLAEVEKTRGDVGEKASKLQVEFFSAFLPVNYVILVSYFVPRDSLGLACWTAKPEVTK